MLFIAYSDERWLPILTSHWYIWDNLLFERGVKSHQPAHRQKGHHQKCFLMEPARLNTIGTDVVIAIGLALQILLGVFHVRSFLKFVCTFSQPLKEECISEVVRIGSIPFIWESYEKSNSSYCMMLYFWWGCRRNLNLITLGSERVTLW